jgi:hypothetical protein
MPSGQQRRLGVPTPSRQQPPQTQPVRPKLPQTLNLGAVVRRADRPLRHHRVDPFPAQRQGKFVTVSLAKEGLPLASDQLSQIVAEAEGEGFGQDYNTWRFRILFSPPLP